jgi:hypothetical protein
MKFRLIEAERAQHSVSPDALRSPSTGGRGIVLERERAAGEISRLVATTSAK